MATGWQPPNEVRWMAISRCLAPGPMSGAFPSHRDRMNRVAPPSVAWGWTSYKVYHGHIGRALRTAAPLAAAFTSQRDDMIIARSFQGREMKTIRFVSSRRDRMIEPVDGWVASRCIGTQSLGMLSANYAFT